MIAALLSWTGLPQWAMELLALAAVGGLVAGGAAYIHHHIYEEGIAAQHAQDAAQAAKQAQVAQAATEAALKASEQAHDMYQAEQATNLVLTEQLRGNGPPDVSRLCERTVASASPVPKASPSATGASSATSAAPGVPSVPQGDSVGAGPRALLLVSLAAYADEMTARAREWQARQK